MPMQISQVAALWGVTRQRMDEITRQAGFPPPIQEDGRGRFWAKEHIEAYKRLWDAGEYPPECPKCGQPAWQQAIQQGQIELDGGRPAKRPTKARRR